LHIELYIKFDVTIKNKNTEMKNILFAGVLLLSVSLIAQENKSFHDFTVSDIDGNEFALSSLKGKKVLVVNTASKCGLTPQYESLEKLYKEYKDQDFVIIGFPANNFMSQEPGTNEEIKSFCQLNYGVSFPMMSKISVKGKDQHPLYAWLTSKDENGVMDSNVKWNFQKYLINENGELVDVAFPKENPYSDKIIAFIEQ
jgi:glutathione peroxidase